jgi:hypothetical protein
MDAYFGIVLDVNGKEIALEPKTAINKIKEQGIEAELPAGTEVHLGSVGGGLQGFVRTIDPTFNLPKQEDLPLPILQQAYGTLTTAEITINDLYLKIPPGNGAKSYRLGLYVGWPEPKDLVGSLKLKGFSLKIDGTAKDDGAPKKP